MEKKYRIDREHLPYDAFVADESWLGPVDGEGEGNGDEGKEADTDGDQGT